MGAEDGEVAQEAGHVQEPSGLNHVTAESPEEPTAPAPSAVEHFNGVGGVKYPGKMLCNAKSLLHFQLYVLLQCFFAQLLYSWLPASFGFISVHCARGSFS